MNAKADNMRKTIVDILGEDIGKVDFLVEFMDHKFWSNNTN